jgi:hypothetical protein
VVDVIQLLVAAPQVCICKVSVAVCGSQHGTQLVHLRYRQVLHRSPCRRLRQQPRHVFLRGGLAQLVLEREGQRDQARDEKGLSLFVAPGQAIVQTLRSQGTRGDQQGAPDLASLPVAVITGIVAKTRKIASATPISVKVDVFNGSLSPKILPPVKTARVETAVIMTICGMMVRRTEPFQMKACGTN